MFIGRTRELKILTELFEKTTASLVVCRGRRRIGKSRLIREFGGTAQRYLSFQGLAPREGMSEEIQLNSFAESLAQQTSVPKIKLESWTQAFALLASQLDTKRTVILLDEVSWMSSGCPDFAGYLKNAWDTSFSQNSNLIVVLCGSVSTWLEKNILNNTAFVGRLSLTLTLDQLPLAYCNQFWGTNSNRISCREKLEFLAVSGGVPRYLEEIRPHEPTSTTLQRLCFTKEGFLFNEFESIWSDLFSRRGPIYRKLVESLCDGPKGLTELSRSINTARSGRLANYLNDLELSGFIRKETQRNIAEQNDKHIGKLRYRLIDPYVRFYLKQIAPKLTSIAQNQLLATPLDRIINWDSILGLQFETLLLNNIAEVCKALEIDISTVTGASPYIQKKSAQQKGCQIDLMIQTKYSLWLCEIKCCKSIGIEVINEMQNKIVALKIPKRFSVRTALIYAAELSENVRSEGYFDKLISFSQLIGS